MKIHILGDTPEKRMLRILEEQLFAVSPEQRVAELRRSILGEAEAGPKFLGLAESLEIEEEP